MNLRGPGSLNNEHIFDKHFHFLLPHWYLFASIVEEETAQKVNSEFVFVDELSPGQTCPVWLLAMRSPVPSMEEPRTDYLPQPSATASANN